MNRTRALASIALIAVAGVLLLSSAFLQSDEGFVAVRSNEFTYNAPLACTASDEDDNSYIEFGENCGPITPDPPEEPPITEGGWIEPVVGVNVGHEGAPERDMLTNIEVSGTGLIIDNAFLSSNSGAEWLKDEDGRVVIDGIQVEDACINIQATLTIRNSYINCPVRSQANAGPWGYPGSVSDTPAVYVAADNVVIERNTITCSGADFDICGRNIWVAGDNTKIRYNDLSFARGAVQVFNNLEFEYNYLHSFSYGADPNRAGNTATSGSNPDEITHNNAVNNQGYNNATIKGNFIDARYGRVSEQPNRYLNPYYRTSVYPGGVVEVGHPINGFTFTNYLSANRNGAGYTITNNYVEHSGRPFRCNSSRLATNAECLKDFSYNAFVDDRFDDFGAILAEDADGQGTMAGSCNYRFDNDVISYLPNDFFGSRFNHPTNNC